MDSLTTAEQIRTAYVRNGPAALRHDGFARNVAESDAPEPLREAWQGARAALLHLEGLLDRYNLEARHEADVATAEAAGTGVLAASAAEQGVQFRVGA